jgi:hypothetical protein
MLIASRIINVSVLITDMLVEGIPSWKISALLKPHDAQNVPIAIELVRTLCALGSTWKNADLEPTVRERRRTLAIFGHWFGSYLEAYANLDLSLDEQLHLLSKFSHLSVIPYCLEGNRLMSSQLYADSQTNVKSAFVHVHKQQLLDPSQPVYLIITDSDPLEEHFGIVRMMGGHRPNVDIQELCDTSGGALDLANVYEQFPEWHMGSGRRSTDTSVGADHHKPRHVRGNVIAGHARPTLMWHTGLDAAQDVNDEFGISNIALRKHYSDTTDTLRPHGDGQYVGVKSEPDRSMETVVADPHVERALMRPEATASELPTIVSSVSRVSSPVPEPLDARDNIPDAACSSGSGSTSAQALTPIDATESNSVSELAESNSESDGAGLLSFRELAFQHADPVLLSRPVEDFVTLPSGKKIHKQSHIKISFNLAQPGQSKDRLQRVQGFKPATLTIASGDCSLSGPDDFVVGDLFATLVIVQRRAHLAILECIEIRQGGQVVHGQPVSRASMAVKEAGIELKGQVYAFAATEGENGVTLWQCNVAESSGIARLRPENLASKARDIVHITVSASAAIVLSPEVAHFAGDSDQPVVWTYSDSAIGEVVDRAFAQIKPEHLADLPVYGVGKLFPYLNRRGACHDSLSAIIHKAHCTKNQVSQLVMLQASRRLFPALLCPAQCVSLTLRDLIGLITTRATCCAHYTTFMTT